MTMQIVGDLGGGLVAVETIKDLRSDRRAGPFWKTIAYLVESAEQLVEMRFRPKRQCGLLQSLFEARRLWDLIEIFRHRPFAPMPGDEIMMRAGSYFPHNGSHRAAALRALELDVPALLVIGWKHDRRRPVKWQHKAS